MSLSQDDILKLLTKPERAKGKKLDTSIRIVEVWFELQHKLYDEEKQEMAKCSNPSCTDPRARAQLVAEINGALMCRRCFLSGYNA
jgi:hypothetical protein